MKDVKLKDKEFKAFSKYFNYIVGNVKDGFNSEY